MGCPRRRPVFSPVHVVNTPVLGTTFQFVRRTPSKSRDCARARNVVELSGSAEIHDTHETLLGGN